MKTLIMTLLFIGTFSALDAKKVSISCSESDAKIFLDGRFIGYGSMMLNLPKNSCGVVLISKTGYVNQSLTFCNSKRYAKPPKAFHVSLKRDDSYDASKQTDLANVNMGINTKYSEDKAWKLISQIVTSYFDIVEIADKDTGYLRTAWVVKRFSQNTIRTRVIVKLSSVEPLSYKIKLVSEQSGGANTSVKQDELFSSWDRVLKTYSGLVEEIQNRLKG